MNFKEIRNTSRESEHSASGFTLIELLVVMAIIALVISGIGIALRSGDESVALGNAQRTMASLVSAARGQAIMNGTNARLIIHNDPNEPDRYLRTVGIVVEVVDQDGLPRNRWRATNDGTRLPRGIYFVPHPNQTSFPPELFGSEWDMSNDAFSRFGERTMNIEFPRTESGGIAEGTGDTREWIYYEFRSNGTMRASASDNLQIVLASGRRTQTIPVFENPENVRGLVLRNIGTYHLVDDRLSFHETD